MNDLILVTYYKSESTLQKRKCGNTYCAKHKYENKITQQQQECNRSQYKRTKQQKYENRSMM